MGRSRGSSLDRRVFKWLGLGSPPMVIAVILSYFGIDAPLRLLSKTEPLPAIVQGTRAGEPPRATTEHHGFFDRGESDRAHGRDSKTSREAPAIVRRETKSTVSESKRGETKVFRDILHFLDDKLADRDDAKSSSRRK